MSAGYEVGTGVSIRAFHVIPGAPGREGERHSHEYRVEVVVERARLDERGMVCDLDVLNAAVGEVATRLEGADLETIRPPEAEAVTVEVFARWVHDTLSEAVRLAGGEVLGVRVWESPGEFGGYRRELARPPLA